MGVARGALGSLKPSQGGVAAPPARAKRIGRAAARLLLLGGLLSGGLLGVRLL